MAKYGPKAQALVAREMKAMEAGKLRSGGNGAKVTNPKQAIAIALSEARKEGAKMPPPPDGTASATKTRGTKTTTTKNASAKKAPAKKTAATKAATKKTATKKAPAKKASAKKAATK